MISNERSWPSHSHVSRPPYREKFPPRPYIQEDTLKSVEFQIERKFFTVALKENPRGRFVRINEDNAGKRNSIIIPATGLQDFKKALLEMVKVADALLSKGDSPQQVS